MTGSERKSMLLDVLGYGTVIAVSALLLIVSFWLLWPYKTMDVAGVKIVDTTVKQGGVLSFYVTYTRYTDVDTTVYRDFVDGLVFTTLPEGRKSEAGTFTRLVEVEIPSTLPPGRYSLKTNVTFHVNPIRAIPMSFSTGMFTVLPRNP